MSELQSSDWSETAASNNAAAPNGAPEGMLGSAVNNTMREMMAAIKRDWNRSHVTISSTGSANAYVLTYANAPTYTHGIRLSFKANFANDGAATVNANALGAKSIVRNDGATALVANDIVVNQHVDLEYDSALDKLVMLTAHGQIAGVGDHEVTVHTGNGYGSTNTKIRRFTTALVNTGTAITYADSATLGATFTINETGIYSIIRHDGNAAINAQLGISVNTSAPTTAISSIAVADRLCHIYEGTTGLGKEMSITKRFAAGDVIRAHDGAALCDNATDSSKFTIVKIGS